MRPFSGVGFTHPRGPRIGYWNWDMPGLESAVHVDGTINDNKDRDRGWTAELRIPWRSLEPLAMPDRRALPPRDGDEWRMDFSRFNQYKGPRRRRIPAAGRGVRMACGIRTSRSSLPAFASPPNR